MAAVIHISEAEAARDLPALVDRALAGDEVVLSRSGRDVVVLSAVVQGESAMRPLGEIIGALKQRKATQGLATVDDEFATDMKTVHEEWNKPLELPPWD